MVGTSGLSEGTWPTSVCVSGEPGQRSWSANFAIGAVLLVRLCRSPRPTWTGRGDRAAPRRQARRALGDGHAHRGGHRRGPAGRRAAGRSRPTPPPSRCWPAPGAARAPAGCACTRSACPGLVAHEEVIFGAAGPEPHHPPRLLRPALVHAGRPAGRPPGAGAAGPDRGARGAARAVNESGSGSSRRPTTASARWGLAKTTVEDAAREAGVSRATVYRYFPGGRDELDLRGGPGSTPRFFPASTEVVRTPGRWRRSWSAGLAFAHRALRGARGPPAHPETEPEVLLPRLTAEAERPRRCRRLPGALPGAPRAWRRGDLDGAADFLARMVLSYIASPGRWDLTTPSRWRCWCAPSCWPASGERPAAEPARPGRRRPRVRPDPEPAAPAVRALRPTHGPAMAASSRSAGRPWPCTRVGEGRVRTRSRPTAHGPTRPGGRVDEVHVEWWPAASSQPGVSCSRLRPAPAGVAARPPPGPGERPVLGRACRAPVWRQAKSGASSSTWSGCTSGRRDEVLLGKLRPPGALGAGGARGSVGRPRRRGRRARARGRRAHGAGATSSRPACAGASPVAPAAAAARVDFVGRGVQRRALDWRGHPAGLVVGGGLVPGTTAGGLQVHARSWCSPRAA